MKRLFLGTLHALVWLFVFYLVASVMNKARHIKDTREATINAATTE